MKKTLGAQTLLYPKPALLVGTIVEGKPNFMTVAWGGIACKTPPMLSVAIRTERHTYRGVTENQTFSVNIPPVSLVREVDYCGIVSGRQADKVADCGFTVFYGELKTAPLIEECPINLECRLHRKVELGSHVLCIGEIVQVHATESCLTDGRPDIRKVKPLAFASYREKAYYAVGEKLASAFEVGRDLPAAR
jgi:flavin reductase (DIM6/NTAB) family NADH-FMN oxidoreductase RutF